MREKEIHLDKQPRTLFFEHFKKPRERLKVSSVLRALPNADGLLTDALYRSEEVSKRQK